MVISKGEDWGEDYDGEVVDSFDSEFELAQIVKKSYESGNRLVASLTQGDLLNSFGGGSNRKRIYEMDFCIAELDDKIEYAFISFFSAGKPFRSADVNFAINGTSVGSWQLGPRSHPNDGLLDITRGTMTLTQLFLARKKAKNGAHLPHPNLKYKRLEKDEWCFKKPKPIFCDQKYLGKAKKVKLWVIGDGFSLIV